MNSKGQSLVELIIVISVSILVISALAFATITSLRNAQFAKNKIVATKLAQEGIETLKSARNRDGQISNLHGGMDSWDDDTFWDRRINTSCIDPCYFKLGAGGSITSLGGGGEVPGNAERLQNNQFTRVIILSDESLSYQLEKTVTVLVLWSDFSGSHESRLATILRRL